MHSDVGEVATDACVQIWVQAKDGRNLEKISFLGSLWGAFSFLGSLLVFWGHPGMLLVIWGQYFDFWGRWL
jgi:hypothetical protein